LEAAQLRENLAYKNEQEYGEREGDDYALPEEEFERLYEQDEQDIPAQSQPAQQQPIVRTRQVDAQGRSVGKGDRKAAKAVVWLKRGTGVCTVNGRPHTTYFVDWDHRSAFFWPFSAVDRLAAYDVQAMVRGGGKSGQSGAVQLAIARALVKQEPALFDKLKQKGYLTRDPRKKERRKPGKRKARKGYTFVKR